MALNGVRAAVEPVPGAEDAVMLAHLKLCERPAECRAVPVRAGDEEVARSVVALDASAEVRAGRREGVHPHAA